MGTALLSGNSNYRLDVDDSLSSQNQSANFSTIYWRHLVTKLAGSGYWGTSGSNNWSASSNVGGLGGASGFAYDFRTSSGVPVGGSVTFGQGYYNVGHDANGYGSRYTNGYISLIELGSASAGTGTRSLPRIPKRPSVPGTPVASNVMPTSLKLDWTPSSDNAGSTIDSYLVRRWLGSSPTGSYTDISSTNTITRTDTGLTPGTTYTYGIYAHNGSADNSGYSNLSGTVTVKTIAPIRVKVAGIWKYAVPYVKVAGEWKMAQPFVKVAGNWKATG